MPLAKVKLFVKVLSVAKYIIIHIIEVAEVSYCVRRAPRLNLKGMIYMNIRTYGLDERLAFCREYLYKRNIRSASEIFLLPIPTSRDGVTVGATGKTPEELFQKIPYGAVVAGYEIPMPFKEYFSSFGASVADVSFDERFTEENAKLTAEAAVGKILTEHGCAPSDLSVGIVGYGRIGKHLTSILAFLGASLTVLTTRREVAEELCMAGISGAFVSFGEDVTYALSSLDILINTAPARLIDERAAEVLLNTEVIELASGDNLPRGLKFTRLSALPAKTYPKSAGRVLADSVVRMLGES